MCGTAAAAGHAETVWRNQCKIQKIFYLLVITKSGPASAAYLEVSRAAAAKQMSHSGEIPITFGSSQKLAINFDHSFPIVRAGSLRCGQTRYQSSEEVVMVTASAVSLYHHHHPLSIVLRGATSRCPLLKRRGLSQPCIQCGEKDIRYKECCYQPLAEFLV